MSDRAPEYFKDLGLSDQVFNESDMLAYGVFEGAQMSDSDRDLERTKYVAVITLISNAIDDFYTVHSTGDKLDEAYIAAKNIDSPELRNRALQLIKLVSNIALSGNADNQLDSIKRFIQVESVHHSSLRAGSPIDDAGSVAKCETDIVFSGADATEFNSAKIALLGLSKLVASKATTTSASGTDLTETWLKNPDASNFFPEDIAQNKLLAATVKSSKISVIERIGLVAQAETLLSIVETPGQADILRTLIAKAKGEVLLRGVEELRKDVMQDVRASNGISAKRHIAKAKLLVELMPEGASKRSALQKVASAERAFGTTADSDDQGTRDFKIDVPAADDDNDLDELDRALIKSHKTLYRLVALFSLLATFATVVATHQDEAESILSSMGDGMSERFIEPADRMIGEFQVWLGSIGRDSESEKAATHEAVGILDDALKAGAEKTGNDTSSLAPILSGKTAPVTEAVPEERPVQPAAVAPEADENVPSFQQIDTALVHFKYTDDGRVVATGKIDFKITAGTLELISRDFEVDHTSYLKFKVTGKDGKTSEIYVLSPAEVSKQEILGNIANGTFTVPVFTFSKDRS
ncbi:MAG: hypothetical protein US89_C0001G0007 [Candidatus Peregrinibacteria bacterium GW2011_GWF2_38_29]|nr:MAG: hypothetical protein US89_C0001G0007 [Candidatus Peregrinibacteria bacterium GW2011_GWF2_38_29]HBB03042.1 hypothetical protein [Candidatus Peregrinibacteria bacterium]